MELAWPSMPSFKIDTLWPDFLKTHLMGDSPMDNTLYQELYYSSAIYNISGE